MAAPTSWNEILDSKSPPPDQNSPVMQAAKRGRNALRSFQSGVVEPAERAVGQGVSGLYDTLHSWADQLHPTGKK